MTDFEENEPQQNQKDFLYNMGIDLDLSDAKLKQIEQIERENEKRVRAERLGLSGISQKYINTTLNDYRTETAEQKKNLGIIKNYLQKLCNSWNENLWLCGANGNGKTMLASVIVSELILHLGKSGIRLVKSYEIEDELETCKYFNAKRTKDAVLNEYYNYNLLLIDEVGRFKSPAEANFLFRILNERYERNLGTVLISNMNKNELKDFLGAALFDRFCENCQSAEFTETSYRRKINK